MSLAWLEKDLNSTVLSRWIGSFNPISFVVEQVIPICDVFDVLNATQYPLQPLLLSLISQLTTNDASLCQ